MDLNNDGTIKPGNNGHELTESELLEKKKKLFAEDPDRFIDVTELICATVKHGENGVVTIIGNGTRRQFGDSWVEINLKLTTILQMIDAKIAQDKAKIVQPGKHGIFDFAKRRK